MLTVDQQDAVTIVTLDDGKANAVGFDFCTALHEGLDRAEADGSAVAIVGRPGVLSAGFDLKIVRQGWEAAMPLRKEGARLLARLLLHPQPVVVACTGHALAAGALILLAGDTRVGAAGDFKIGLNETAIGLPLGPFALSLAGSRIPSRYLTEATIQARIYDPDAAIERAYLDEVVDADALIDTALTRATALLELDMTAYGIVKRRVRVDTARSMVADFGIDLVAEGWLDPDA
jgi:enoyl-CoA hydratase